MPEALCGAAFGEGGERRDMSSCAPTARGTAASEVGRGGLLAGHADPGIVLAGVDEDGGA